MKDQKSWKTARRLIVVLLMCFVMFSHTVSAKEAVTDEPASVQKGGITLESKRWSYNHYEVLTDYSQEWFLDKLAAKNVNGLDNFFFSLTKLTAELIDAGIERLYSLDVIKMLSGQVGKIGDVLWDNIWQSMGILFFLIAVMQIFFVFVFKRNGQDALKRALNLFLVLGISVLWFSQSSFYMNALNGLSSETQGVVMKAGTEFTKDYVTDRNETITPGQELDGSLSIMRNAYFNLIVQKPYLLMNYGTPKKSAIKDYDKRVDKLLSYKQTEKGSEAREEAIEEDVKEYDNLSLSPASLWSNLGIAFISFLFSLLLGIPLLLVAFFNVIISIFVLFIWVAFPLTLALSIIPAFGNMWLTTLMQAIGALLMKAILGLFILFLFLIITISEKVIPITSVGMYFLNTVFVAACIILMIMKRNEFVKLFSAGKVQSLDQKMPERSLQKMKHMLGNKKETANNSNATEERKATRDALEKNNANDLEGYSSRGDARSEMGESDQAKTAERFDRTKQQEQEQNNEAPEIEAEHENVAPVEESTMNSTDSESETTEDATVPVEDETELSDEKEALESENAVIDGQSLESTKNLEEARQERSDQAEFAEQELLNEEAEREGSTIEEMNQSSEDEGTTALERENQAEWADQEALNEESEQFEPQTELSNAKAHSETMQTAEPKTLEQDTTLENNRASQEDTMNESATNTADATDVIEEVRQLEATPQQESTRKEKEAVKEVETDTNNTENLTPDETRQEADHEEVNRNE
ncbi:CD3337/EF1877 family mobilome membrane protein [Brochothrix thermosphacta]|uniref:Uncharacterized protein n=1 Tax=Brochothrix thermosphacta TaxID=2756 RepID=A0A2X0QF26_BROTH|nr:hypothetical protein [Brochothrix thermosphacta]SPP27239.1 conserved membrane hypothetical protein [Brochothrix thermosphacta]